MKMLVVFLMFSAQAFAGPIFPLQSSSSAISCQWYNPMTYQTEYECQGSCNFDCSIIYGPNYTGYHGCAQQEFGYDCYCGVCY